MQGILAFIFIFGVIVVVHEFGHFYFAKKSGILVREFAIGMGPKLFAHIGKDGTAYTIRMLPLGGYVRMAGWGEDKTEIKTGTPVSLVFNEAGLVSCINLSNKLLENGLPMQVTSYDFEEKLTIQGIVLEENKTFSVDHDATIIEEDGTEVRIAPLDVQYQNAPIWGKLMTNFAGPMNNFILGIVAFIWLFFLQGGVPNEAINEIRVVPNGALEQVGVQSGDRILKINEQSIRNWQDISSAIDEVNQHAPSEQPVVQLLIQSNKTTREVEVPLKKEGDRYLLGVLPGLDTRVTAKVIGGFRQAGRTALLVVDALKNIIARFDIQQLGGPVAIYTVSSQAAQDGFLSVLSLLAMLSINLGIFNLIPIPALDGGKIVINLLELIRRKPLKEETETYITLAGVALMVILMLAVTWNDIMRVFF